MLAVKNYVDQVSLHGTKRVGTELAVEKRSKRTRVTQDQPLKVRVRRVARMGRGKYQCATARNRLDIAFDPDRRHKVLSRKFDLGTKSIIRNQQLVAESLCMAQSAWLASLEALCQRYRPLAVCTSRKWDETAENSVRLATIAEVGQHLQVDTVEVLVSSIRAVVCWRENTGSALVLDINVPPCPLTTTSADCIHAALSRHPQVSPLWELTQRLLKLGKYCTHTNECDGHSGNDRLHFHGLNDPVTDDIHGAYGWEMCLCGNHQQHLTTLSVVTCLGLDLVNDVYAATLFFNGATAFVNDQCFAHSSPPPRAERVDTCYAG